MESVLEIENLSVEYKTPDGFISAVQDFTLRIGEGETYGLVGESGSGKSTVAWVIMRYLAENGRVAGGKVRFKGQDLMALGIEELRHYRGKRIAMVYQDPMTSLNPSMMVGRQIQERIGSSLPVVDVQRGSASSEPPGPIAQVSYLSRGTKSIGLGNGMTVEAVNDPTALSDSVPTSSLVISARDLDEIIDILGPGSHVLIRQ